MQVRISQQGGTTLPPVHRALGVLEAKFLKGGIQVFLGGLHQKSRKDYLNFVSTTGATAHFFHTPPSFLCMFSDLDLSELTLCKLYCIRVRFAEVVDRVQLTLVLGRGVRAGIQSFSYYFKTLGYAHHKYIQPRVTASQTTSDNRAVFNII